MNEKPQGYRELTDLELGAINDIKALENRVGDLVSTLRGADLDLDPGWVAIAVRDLQKGFMALVRSVARPNSRLK